MLYLHKPAFATSRPCGCDTSSQLYTGRLLIELVEAACDRLDSHAIDHLLMVTIIRRTTLRLYSVYKELAHLDAPSSTRKPSHGISWALGNVPKVLLDTS